MFFNKIILRPELCFSFITELFKELQSLTTQDNLISFIKK
ncbi:hypothetical protein FLJC2902T_14490 [Flavobacterium limnosediminis JC2902]|uniref:Uncharacterized protein n=1 Tax=Flavobacterium limnosediminis JC2902 TaxID=1341181 RepID=V6SRN9_9FLAO|nr:hypothetical protein FLJC2902T_14490 [Flavobacterium limnosediminis JC2902]